MSRIIVDVTQLVHWSGKITGIPRVMEELAVRFDRAHELDVVFASWVKDLGEFCEVDFAETMKHRGSGIDYVKKGSGKPARAAVEAPRPTIESPSDPDRRRKITLKRVAKYGLRKASRVSPRWAARMEQRAKLLTLASYQTVEFQKGDQLFIPWGEWWDETFTARLERANREQGVRLVQIIHDVATTVWPQFYEKVDVSPKDYNARIIPLADLVLCVSQNTKRELVGWLKEEKLHVPRTEVFRLGDVLEVAKPARPDDSAFTQSGLKGGDYLLCVGTIEAKKNHAMFYYVYKRAHQQGVKLPKLVVVGRRGWGTENMYNVMSNDPEIGKNFIFLHNAGDENLTWLYDHCLFTVLPSFHEGWGIPIAESLSRGVPCACSDTSSMVEIGEGIVEHFSPYSTDECLAAIVKLLDPKALAAARKKTASYKRTTWDDTFTQVKHLLEK